MNAVPLLTIPPSYIFHVYVMYCPREDLLASPEGLRSM